MPARNFYRRHAVASFNPTNPTSNTYRGGARAVKVPSPLPIPNLEALKDIDAETFQALSSLQESQEVLAYFLQRVVGRIGQKPRPPLNTSVSLPSVPNPKVLITFTPDSQSETPPSYYKVYRANAGNAVAPTTPNFSSATFVFPVTAQDLAYLPSGSAYSVVDDTIGPSAFIFPGNPSLFSYWVSAVDPYGRESFPAPASGSPITLNPSQYSNLNLSPMGRAMNLLYNGKMIGTSGAAVVTQKNVSTVTNASPISVTTTANHGMATGDQCFISGVTGTTSANGYWTITSTGATTFTLNGSSGNGAYVNNGIVYPAIGQPPPQGPKDQTGGYVKTPWVSVTGTAPTFHTGLTQAGYGLQFLTGNTASICQTFTINQSIANIFSANGQVFVSMLLTPTSANPPVGGSIAVSLPGATSWNGATWTFPQLSQNIPCLVFFPCFGLGSNLNGFSVTIATTSPAFDFIITDVMFSVGNEPLPFTEYEEPNLAGYAQGTVASPFYAVSSSASPPY